MDYLGMGESEFSNEKQSDKPAVLELGMVPFAGKGMIVWRWGEGKAGLVSNARSTSTPRVAPLCLRLDSVVKKKFPVELFLKAFWTSAFHSYFPAWCPSHSRPSCLPSQFLL